MYMATKRSRKRSTPLSPFIILIILIAGLVSVSVLTKSSQDNRQRAAEYVMGRAPNSSPLPSALPLCNAPSQLNVTRVCKSGGTMDTTWGWNAVPGATYYNLELHYNGYPNISIPNIPTTSREFNNASDRTLYGRVRVYHSDGSCAAPGNWSNMIFTESCVNPPASPAPNSCQCDQGVVTLNNCSAGNVPQCSGMSKCSCISNN